MMNELHTSTERELIDQHAYIPFFTNGSLATLGRDEEKSETFSLGG